MNELSTITANTGVFLECAYRAGNYCTFENKLHSLKCSYNCPNYITELTNLNVGQNTIELKDSQMQIVKLCKKIRLAAASGSIRFDKSEHSRSNNLYLKNFIELCGFSFKQFVISYLEDIQPYSLFIDESQSRGTNIICLIDFGYSCAMYIKVDTTDLKEIVLSFHENQFEKLTKYKRMQADDKCLLLVKTNFPIGSYCTETVAISHGFCKFKENISGRVVRENLLEVNSVALDNIFLDYANERLQELWNTASNKISKFRRFKQYEEVSFTSFGTQLLNKISLILDNTVHSETSQQMAVNLTILNEQFDLLKNLPDYEDYIKALYDRYNVKTGADAEKIRSIIATQRRIGNEQCF